MNYRASIIVLLLAAAGPAFGHNELPTLTACSGHRPIYLGAFHYSERNLREYKACLRRDEGSTPPRRSGGGGALPPVCHVNSIPITAVACPAETCGEFDDDYRTARALALATCTGYVGAGTGYPEDSLVVPIFSGPSSFLGADHHLVYDLSDGLSGMCALCPDEVR